MDNIQFEQWLGDSKLAYDIWSSKYQVDNETFEEWLSRVTNKDEEMQELLLAKKYLFGGRILANRLIPQTTGKRGTYSNCYVIGHPEDNIESIFEFNTKLARTFSYGGGCGGDLSYLAPNGAKVNNSAEYSSGAVSFMDLFSQTTETISQKGRRGALMLCMDIKHPDIEEFMDCKSDLERVTKANISVKVPDEFMDTLKADKDWTMSFTRQETGECISKTKPAKELMQKLAFNAWDIADPGILYWDNMCGYNLLDHDPDFKYDGTNPCGEEPLPAGGSCLLSSINLSEFVEEPFTEEASFNLPSFKNVVKFAVRQMNTLLDEGLELHPLQEQRDSVRDWRQIGVGIMGLADTFVKMGIRYGSERSIKLINQIGRAMANAALQESAKLAKQHGPYPKYNKQAILSSTYLNTVAEPKTIQMISDYGLRNSQLLTIAPTGTLSTMLGISGGIEPIFATSYTRKTESLHGEDVYYKVCTPIIEQLTGYTELPEDYRLPDYVVTAHEIPYEERIAVQAAFQKYIDASISSTVNLPNSATVEDVLDVYVKAHEAGCKGITVYRDGCRRAGILTTGGDKESSKPESLNETGWGTVIPSSDNTLGLNRRLMTGCGTLWVNAFFDLDTGRLSDIFLSKGSKGGCNSFMVGLSRLISQSARAGVPLAEICDQLQSSVECASFISRTRVKKDTSAGVSCPSSISKALLDMEQEFLAYKSAINGTPIHVAEEQEVFTFNDECPECGVKLEQSEGCVVCRNCGWSKCG